MLQARFMLYPDGRAASLRVNYDNAKDITFAGAISKDGKLAYITFKVPGGKHWASMMETQKSHGGTYEVVRVDKVFRGRVHGGNGRDTLIVEGEVVQSIPLRSTPDAAHAQRVIEYGGKDAPYA